MRDARIWVWDEFKSQNCVLSVINNVGQFFSPIFMFCVTDLCWMVNLETKLRIYAIYDKKWEMLVYGCEMRYLKKSKLVVFGSIISLNDFDRIFLPILVFCVMDLCWMEKLLLYLRAQSILVKCARYDEKW